MKVVTQSEFTELERNPEFSWYYRDASPEQPWIFDASDQYISFNFEKNSPRRKDDLDTLCEDFQGLFAGFTTAYLHISEPELFIPSGLSLVHAIRRAYGESRTVEEAPSHIFTGDEADLLWGFYFLMVQMSWSFHITFPQYPCAIGYSFPGEHYFISWKSSELYQRAKELLKDFHPEFQHEEKKS